MDFYYSNAWRKLSRYIKMIKRGVCEECGLRGTEVHHIIPINDANVDDQNISLNPDNLQLLCTSCHNAKRKADAIREGLTFTENGDVIETPPIVKKKHRFPPTA